MVEWLNVEQPKVSNIRVDLLARMEDGRLRHVEMESKNDSGFARRAAEYYLGFHRLLGEHVDQIVLYVGREPLRMKPVFETPSMRYEFEILDLRTFDGEPLLASEDWGDNLLALLTPVDQERVLRRVEEQLRRLRGEEQETAAKLCVILSGIIGIEESVVKRLHMIDIMENKVLGPAIRQGIAQGKAEGMAEGKAEGERALLARQLGRRFGAIPENFAKRIENAAEPELMTWADRVLTAKTLAEVFGS